jgi:hypothetical protein
LTAPIDNDKVRIDLDANGLNPVMDLDWNGLDGEWIDNSSTVSGDEVVGADFEFTFNVLPTDVDNSTAITNSDYDLIHQLDGKTTLDVGYVAKRDINGDGTIDTNDWADALDRAFQSLPSGTPAGVDDDAPTTSGLGLFSIDNEAVNYAIPLSSYFDDHEDGGENLTYSIVSNNNSALFDAASISGTNTLLVNAAANVSGRGVITIRATDSNGISVDAAVTIDVNRDNVPPEIVGFSISAYAYGIFIVSGRVIDADDDVSNAIVNLWGVFSTRAAVDDLGYFLFAVYMRRWPSGLEYASTVDIHGVGSDIEWHQIYMT